LFKKRIKDETAARYAKIDLIFDDENYGEEERCGPNSEDKGGATKVETVDGFDHTGFVYNPRRNLQGVPAGDASISRSALIDNINGLATFKYDEEIVL
jgi:hypothetical protein